MSQEDLTALLEEMTLEEKIGQLNMPFPIPAAIAEMLGSRIPSSPDEWKAFIRGESVDGVGPGGGFFAVSTRMPGSPSTQAKGLNELQRQAGRTRLAIPLLQIAEGCHGVVADGATVFPEGPALGSTWDLDLIARVYAAVAREARATGVHLICTLVIEPIRDPRLGRNVEAYTEDPFLSGEIAKAIIDGAQGDDLASPDRAGVVFCAFPGQSEPESGLERGAMNVSDRRLHDIFLEPWRASMDRRPASIMATYPSIDGEVTHSSRRLLTDILRDRLGFDGLLVSEGNGFETLEYEGIAKDQSEAGVRSINAGVDVNITFEDAYLEPLVENVRTGVVDEALIDQAVLRVLEIKQRLGLFDEHLVDPARADEIVNSAEHRQLALEAAREGLVLLKNEGNLLPLDPSVASIAVLGPHATNPLIQAGDYNIQQLREPGEDGLPPMVSVADGIRSVVGTETQVTAFRGCSVLGDDRSEFDAAVDAARNAEVAIVVVGEQVGEFFGTDPLMASTIGERGDLASLDLTGLQQELVDAVVATGTPTVVVLLNGRALSIREIAETVPAVLEAWIPGQEGGTAIGEVLFGLQEPRGRLSVTVPRHVGQLPLTYDQPIGRSQSEFGGGRQHYVDMPSTPLFDFGFGLTYTDFQYSDLRVERVDGELAYDVTVKVTNVGARRGRETVQVYVRDILASLTPARRKLAAFNKIWLDPTQSQLVTLRVNARQLAFATREGDLVIEPGEFEVLVGASAEDTRQSATIEVAPNPNSSDGRYPFI